jgi:hypothetical protein
MVDTFSPLMVTEGAIKLQNEDYYKSWVTE